MTRPVLALMYFQVGSSFIKWLLISTISPVMTSWSYAGIHYQRRQFTSPNLCLYLATVQQDRRNRWPKNWISVLLHGYQHLHTLAWVWSVYWKTSKKRPLRLNGLDTRMDKSYSFTHILLLDLAVCVCVFVDGWVGVLFCLCKFFSQFWILWRLVMSLQKHLHLTSLLN